jgi:hypothetical protein
MVNIQAPPLRLATPIFLPLRSAGVFMSLATTKAPTSLLMKPATKTPSRPFKTAPKLAPDVVP